MYNNEYGRLLGCTRRDSASMMLVTNGIDSFETLYRKYIYKFMKRVEYSSNVIINRMYGKYLVRGGAMHSTWQHPSKNSNSPETSNSHDE